MNEDTTIKDVYQHCIQLDRFKCIYDTLTGKIEFVNSEKDVKINKRSSSVVNELLQKEKSKLKNIVQRKQLYLILTPNCNLSCSYCNQRNHNLHSEKEMTTQDTKHFIQEMAANAEGFESLVFYGGEPLVKSKVFMETIEFVRKQYGKDIAISFITNGTLLTPEIVSFLKSNNVFCALSLDGYLPEHNKYRVDNNGKEVYDKIIQGLNNLSDFGVKAGISCTLGPHNLSYIKDFTQWAVNQKSIGNIYYACPHFEEKGLLNDGVTNEQFGQSFSEAFQVAGYFVENLARIMNTILNGNFKINNCPACGGRVVVRYDGKYGVCTGSLVEGNKFYRNSLSEQAELAYEWSISTTPLNDKMCHSCIAFRVCGGGCPYDTICYTGSLKGKEERRCIITKRIVKESLEWLCKNIDHDKEFIVLDDNHKKELQNKFNKEWFTPLPASSKFGNR